MVLRVGGFLELRVEGGLGIRYGYVDGFSVGF